MSIFSDILVKMSTFSEKNSEKIKKPVYFSGLSLCLAL